MAFLFCYLKLWKQTDLVLAMVNLQGNWYNYTTDRFAEVFMSGEDMNFKARHHKMLTSFACAR